VTGFPPHPGRQDRSADSQDAAPKLALLVAEVGPLRGKAKASPAVEVEGPVQAAGGGSLV
jgi:hypothetical protein